MNESGQENSLAFDLPAIDLTRFSEPPLVPAVGEKYLVFFLEEDFYAVSSKQVAAAAASLPVTDLPNSPEWLLGVANLRGEVIPVINLPVILQREKSAIASKPKFIVLRSQLFETGAAFTANRISEIVFLADEEIEFTADENLPHVFGKAVYKSQTLNLINTEKLLASLKL